MCFKSPVLSLNDHFNICSPLIQGTRQHWAKPQEVHIASYNECFDIYWGSAHCNWLYRNIRWPVREYSMYLQYVTCWPRVFFTWYLFSTCQSVTTSSNSTCWWTRIWSSWVRYSNPGGHPSTACDGRLIDRQKEKEYHCNWPISWIILLLYATANEVKYPVMPNFPPLSFARVRRHKKFGTIPK